MVVIKELLLVGGGGAFGSAARYLVGRVVPTSALPIGTIAVNLIGSFLIGFLAGALGDRLGSSGRLLLITGALGGFTTFAAFAIESTTLVRDGHLGWAVANVALSVVGGLVFAILGVYWGEAVA